MASHVIHSRPYLITDQIIISNQEILAMYQTCGSLATTEMGISVNQNSPAAKIHHLRNLKESLTYLQKCLASVMLEYATKYIFDNVHRREKFKTGFKNSDLSVGTVIFDPKAFRTTLHFSASLGRIEGFGVNQNHVIYSKTIFSKNKQRKQLVTRPTNELYFICKPEKSEEVTFCNDPSVFEFETLRTQMLENCENNLKVLDCKLEIVSDSRLASHRTSGTELENISESDAQLSHQSESDETLSPISKSNTMLSQLIESDAKLTHQSESDPEISHSSDVNDDSDGRYTRESEHSSSLSKKSAKKSDKQSHQHDTASESENKKKEESVKVSRFGRKIQRPKNFYP